MGMAYAVAFGRAQQRLADLLRLVERLAELGTAKAAARSPHAKRPASRVMVAGRCRVSGSYWPLLVALRRFAAVFARHLARPDSRPVAVRVWDVLGLTGVAAGDLIIGDGLYVTPSRVRDFD